MGLLIAFVSVILPFLIVTNHTTQADADNSEFDPNTLVISKYSSYDFIGAYEYFPDGKKETYDLDIDYYKSPKYIAIHKSRKKNVKQQLQQVTVGIGITSKYFSGGPTLILNESLKVDVEQTLLEGASASLKLFYLSALATIEKQSTYTTSLEISSTISVGYIVSGQDVPLGHYSIWVSIPVTEYIIDVYDSELKLTLITKKNGKGTEFIDAYILQTYQTTKNTTLSGQHFYTVEDTVVPFLELIKN
jgi:hypothetical protein